MHRREFIRRLTSSSLEVPACHLVRNFIVKYTCFGGMGLSRTHIAGCRSCQARERGRGPCPTKSNRRIHHSASSIPGRKEKRQQEAAQEEEGCGDLACWNMGSHFTNIGLEIEGLIPEGPPPQKKKKKKRKKEGLAKRMVYKYPRASNFFGNLASTHSLRKSRSSYLRA